MKPTADANINIRTTRDARALIDQAARALGRNRSEFVMEVATERAREVLLDRSRFTLDEDQHARFLELLDEPLPASSAEALEQLLTRKAPWES